MISNDEQAMTVQEPVAITYGSTSASSRSGKVHPLRSDLSRAITGEELMERLRPQLKKLRSDLGCQV